MEKGETEMEEGKQWMEVIVLLVISRRRSSLLSNETQ